MSRILLAVIATLTFNMMNFCSAQMVTTATPMNRVGDSFHENIGSSWSLQGKNWSVNFGNNNANPGASQFGNKGNNGGGLQGGVGFGGNGFSGTFWGQMSQGSSRSMVSQTPSVTGFNGVPGMISDTQQTPFVISNTPVVGSWTGMPGMIDPTGGAYTGQMNTPIPNAAVNQALGRVRAAEDAGVDSTSLKQVAFGSDRLKKNKSADETPIVPDVTPVDREEISSADGVVGSVAQMKRLHEQETVEPMREKAQININKARAAAAKGRIAAAKSYYKTALKYAQDDDVKKTIVQEYNGLVK